MPFYVYITTTRNNTALYTGVTNNLLKRVFEHKGKKRKGFTSKYGIDKLVYYEAFIRAAEAIAREKQIKGGSRQKKIALILRKNRGWEDLAREL
jgi:putative endonuclease